MGSGLESSAGISRSFCINFFRDHRPDSDLRIMLAVLFQSAYWGCFGGVFLLICFDLVLNFVLVLFPQKFCFKISLSLCLFIFST